MELSMGEIGDRDSGRVAGLATVMGHGVLGGPKRHAKGQQSDRYNLVQGHETSIDKIIRNAVNLRSDDDTDPPRAA
jgi:hypothetical protein